MSEHDRFPPFEEYRFNEGDNIISASRYTDIPAFYTDWFFRCMDAGFADVPNPKNPAEVSRVSLKREDIKGFVFWTKNPKPMLARLEELKEKCRTFYFHFTLNNYGREIEPNLPTLQGRIATFRKLASNLGGTLKPDKVIWRYDPIMINDHYTPDWHIATFKQIASELEGATTVCVASFLYLPNPNAARRLQDLELHKITSEMKISLMSHLNEIAAEYGIHLTSCSEVVDLSACGIPKAHCISYRIFQHYCILGWPEPNDEVGIDGIIDDPIEISDKPYRPACECVSGIDIGTRNTCRHGCLYCHACD